jgi:cysteinyl-tRNA synthetase
MKLYNTLTRSKEEFKPLAADAVRIYSCGPTVYNTASIGNLRAYIFTDVLKRTLEFAGFKIRDVMNLTDVGHLVSDADDGEDKVEKAARQKGTTPQEIAKTYTDQYFRDCAKLNIRRPKVVAPATEYVPQMIKFIDGLTKKGFTYLTRDGIYFDSGKFPDYNKLSKQPIEKNKAGARVDLGEKRNAHDFALWKFVPENSMQKWALPENLIKALTAGGLGEIISPRDLSSSFQNGCPGWHIECSAISRELLGDSFDIHTGGVDHITIHHTNEIAQTEGLTGKPMSRFWLHNEFITVDGGKMSKSLGNVFSVDDVEKRGINPLAYRYFCLTAHYRSILNFTWDGLAAAAKAYENLRAALARHKEAKKTPTQEIKTDVQEITDALLDDLNTPEAIAGIWGLVKMAPNRAVFDAVMKFDAVLALDLEKEKTAELIPDEIMKLANERQTKKAAKDFAAADALRAKVAAAGFIINDSPSGFTITRKP